MKKIFKTSDFSDYFGKSDGLIAASIAQEVMENFLTTFLKDPTNHATGEFAQGYRSCINDLMRELENK